MNIFNNLVKGVCPLCRESATLGQFCYACKEDILASIHYHSPRCSYCQLPLNDKGLCDNCHYYHLSLTVYSAFDYAPPLDSLVLRFKNNGQTHLSTCFAQLIVEQLIKKNNLPSKHTVLIPIPSKKNSLKKRAYNPASLFAKSLAKKLQCQLDLSTLRCRQQANADQKTLSRLDRFVSSREQYYCSRRVNYTDVILIDDILTTGSTLESASRALLAAGAQNVQAIVIARTITT